MITYFIRSCGRGREDMVPKNPIIGPHIGGEPGCTVTMDIIYPCLENAQTKHALLITCPMSRYIQCLFVKNLNHATLLCALLTTWAVLFSYPSLIMCDQGRPFQGEIRGEVFRDVWSRDEDYTSRGT